MKALIEISPRGSVFAAARAQMAGTQATGQEADFLLRFESARSLFSELTAARMDLLELLRRTGPCSVYALAKAAERNYSNIHTDIKRLSELGLVERTDGGNVFVPFTEVNIHFSLLQEAA